MYRNKEQVLIIKILRNKEQTFSETNSNLFFSENMKAAFLSDL